MELSFFKGDQIVQFYIGLVRSVHVLSATLLFYLTVLYYCENNYEYCKCD